MEKAGICAERSCCALRVSVELDVAAMDSINKCFLLGKKEEIFTTLNIAQLCHAMRT